MNFRVNGNLGCFTLVFVIIIIFSMFSMLARILFTTPVGVVLLMTSLVYLYFKKKRIIVSKEDEISEDISGKFNDDDAPIIDVDYEEFE